MIEIRSLALSLLVLAFVSAATISTMAQTDKAGEDKTPLTIASWGGAYTKSQDLAYFKPFSEKTGIQIKTAIHDGAFDVLSKGNQPDEQPWDVIDISLEAVQKACDEGVLEPIHPSILDQAPDGTSAEKDYLANGLQKCGVASMAWSSAIVFDKRAFDKKTPDSLKDFFDIKRFPGKRALYKGPKYNIELALMADGVDPDKVYEQLSTDEGLDKALEKLKSIYEEIIWWEKGYEPLRLLARSEASMATAFNGRIFVGIAGRNQPFGIIWDGQIFDLDLWAIPKDSRKKTEAFEFVKFATRPKQMAEQTKWFPYGPMRKSALAMIGKHAEVGIDMAPYIPTAKRNFTKALPFDPEWWNKNKSRVERKFDSWLEANKNEIEDREAKEREEKEAKEKEEKEKQSKASNNKKN